MNLGPGAPAKYPSTTSGSPVLSGLPFLTRRLVATGGHTTQGTRGASGRLDASQAVPTCLHTKFCLPSSTPVWVYVCGPTNLGVSGQPRLAPCPPADTASQTPEPQEANPHFNPQPFQAPRSSKTRGFWAHPPKGAPQPSLLRGGVRRCLGSPLAERVGRLGHHPCPGFCAHHSGQGRECGMFHRPGSYSRQAHKSTDLQGLGLCIDPSA